MDVEMKTSKSLKAVGSMAGAFLGVALAAAAPPLAFGAAPVTPPGLVKHVMVIDLENEGFSTTFGPTSPAVYLNTTLLSQGELIVNYFATSHVSLGNYIAQVSGQGPTFSTNNDCINLASLSHPPVLGGFTDVTPGTDAADQVNNPGQVVGNGCVYPAPTATTRGAQTIGDQLDNSAALARELPPGLHWREYAEDMGADISRDYGDADPLGGADCAHAPIGGSDLSNSAAANDQYATRHNPFVYFHSVIDNVARCNAHVVPLGHVMVGQNGAPDVFVGHLFQDLQSASTTPQFMFITPNLCDDGHDATCAGPNTEGTKNASGHNIGGLVGADLWLKHWMPMIFNSPAYRDGSLLVVLTFDESDTEDARACPNADQSTCNAPVGPNMSNYGFSQILGLFGAQTPPTQPGVYPGGGQVGAVVFNSHLVKPGTVNTTGVYNHFSALRTYEDLLRITEGGDDGQGHLGNAARAGVTPFGADVFNRH
jgi:hypothetical protein